MLDMECKSAYKEAPHKVNAFNQNGVSDRHRQNRRTMGAVFEVKKKDSG